MCINHPELIVGAKITKAIITWHSMWYIYYAIKHFLLLNIDLCVLK